MRVRIRPVVARVMHPRIYRLGYREHHSAFGMTYRHPDTLRSIAYDLGRAEGEREASR